jgi:hypothetical protein
MYSKQSQFWQRPAVPLDPPRSVPIPPRGGNATPRSWRSIAYKLLVIGRGGSLLKRATSSPLSHLTGIYATRAKRDPPPECPSAHQGLRSMRVYVVRGRGVEPEGAGAWREWGGRGRERVGGFKCNGLYEKVIKVKTGGGPPYFSCSLWLSPHFLRKCCVRIAQERRLATRSTHSTPAFVCFPRIQSA